MDVCSSLVARTWLQPQRLGFESRHPTITVHKVKIPGTLYVTLRTNRALKKIIEPLAGFEPTTLLYTVQHGPVVLEKKKTAYTTQPQANLYNPRTNGVLYKQAIRSHMKKSAEI